MNPFVKENFLEKILADGFGRFIRGGQMEIQGTCYLYSLLSQWRRLPPSEERLYENDKTGNYHG